MEPHDEIEQVINTIARKNARYATIAEFIGLGFLLFVSVFIMSVAVQEYKTDPKHEGPMGRLVITCSVFAVFWIILPSTATIALFVASSPTPGRPPESRLALSRYWFYFTIIMAVICAVILGFANAKVAPLVILRISLLYFGHAYIERLKEVIEHRKNVELRTQLFSRE